MKIFALWVETVFLVVYLCFAWGVFVKMLRRYVPQAAISRQHSFWALAAVFALAFGDSFHLLPRIFAALTTEMEYWVTWGLVVDSFIISFFYLFLAIYAQRKFKLAWDGWSWLLVAALGVRLVLLLAPGNDWFGAAPAAWKFYRNLPFAVQGGGVVVIFLRHAGELSPESARRLRGIAYSILISFGFYFATLVGTLWQPYWGAMMLPKTMAYMVAVWLLYQEEFPVT
ncbi:MAG TPA: hypothetical protein G4N98_05570 [Thermoflexia bacterium]|nr:hypothetical protein [Thermoflexia bacterium]